MSSLHTIVSSSKDGVDKIGDGTLNDRWMTKKLRLIVWQWIALQWFCDSLRCGKLRGGGLRCIGWRCGELCGNVLPYNDVAFFTVRWIA